MTPREAEIHARLYPVVATAPVTPARPPGVPHDAGRKYVYRGHGGDGVELELVDMLDDERPTAPDRAGFAFLVLVVLGACVAALVAAGAVAEHVRATGRAEALMCAGARN